MRFLRRYELLILISIILLAAFFRLWQIREYVVFLGDEGRDMIVMRNIFLDGDLPFLGPTASVGGFYLGPIYYWMAAPFLFLTGFDPVGPSIMVALFGIATVFLLYKFAKEATGFWPAAIVASLYAVAPLIVRYSRSSWNPNPLPFFSLVFVYCIFKGLKSKNNIYFFIAGLSFGVAIQLHYLALALAPIAFLIVLINSNFKNYLKSYGLLTVGTIVSVFPFLAFEIKNNFPNFRGILEFVSRGSTVHFKISDFIYSNLNLGSGFFEWIAYEQNTLAARLIFITLTVFTLFATIKYWKDKQKRLIYSLGLIWFVGGLFLLRSYRGQLYDYYLGILFPAPFYVFAIFTDYLWKNVISKLIIISTAILILVIFISNGFYNSPPNNLLNQTEQIALEAIKLSENKDFNFALISSSNSDHAYRYFLEIKNHKPKPLEEMITNQLIVICETEKCEPLGHPLWEIAAFGRAEITKEVSLEKYKFKIFKLNHWPGEPSRVGEPAKKGI